MAPRTLTDRLESLDAHFSIIEWFDERPEMTLENFWATSQRADWMLWLAGRQAGRGAWPSMAEVVVATCDCVETVLRYFSDDEERPSRAIEAARSWAASPDEETAVRRALAAWSAAFEATYASAYADWSAVRVVKVAGYATAEVAWAACNADLAESVAVWASNPLSRAAGRAAQAHRLAGVTLDLADIVRTTLRPGPVDEIDRPYEPLRLLPLRSTPPRTGAPDGAR